MRYLFYSGAGHTGAMPRGESAGCLGSCAGNYTATQALDDKRNPSCHRARKFLFIAHETTFDSTPLGIRALTKKGSDGFMGESRGSPRIHTKVHGNTGDGQTMISQKSEIQVISPGKPWIFFE